MAPLPTGVEIHNGKIRIWFVYREVRCREVLKGWANTTTNIRKAGNLRASIVGDIQLGTFDYLLKFPESKAVKKFTTAKRITTFSELCEVFIKIKKLELSPASHNTLTCKINVLLHTISGNTLISDIQHTDVLRYRQELLTGKVIHSKKPWLEKTGRAASTVNGLMGTLCSMLKLANRSQFISHAPHENVKNLKISKKDPDPLSFDEYQILTNGLARQHALLWIIAVHTGLRHGELCALAWEDINLETGEMHISRNLTAKGMFVPPKTPAGVRKITLLRVAIEALKEQFEATGNNSECQIVFHHKEYGRSESQSLRFVFKPGKQSRREVPYFSEQTISYSWRAGFKRMGLRYRHPYQSRHTFACWLLTAGANPSFIASQMGHENAKMVYEVYSKWISEMSPDQVGMLNSRLSAGVSPLCPQGI